MFYFYKINWHRKVKQNPILKWNLKPSKIQTKFKMNISTLWTTCFSSINIYFRKAILSISWNLSVSLLPRIWNSLQSRERSGPVPCIYKGKDWPWKQEKCPRHKVQGTSDWAAYHLPKYAMQFPAFSQVLRWMLLNGKLKFSLWGNTIMCQTSHCSK